ncbi:MAG: hypothetical protein ACXWL9_08670, partial [Syntrophales bacterium]
IKGPPGGEIGDTKAKISFLTGVYFMKPVQFYIFKPGYCPSPAVPGITICVERTRLQGEEGDGGILELPKLTSQEDRRKAVWKRPDAWFEMTENKQKAKRVKNFLRLLSEEEKRLGLDEEPMWKEIENEK